EMRSLGGPFWLVDCASVVPSAIVPKSACHRAYAYERATEALHAQLAPKDWTEVHAGGDANAPLDFELPAAVDLRTADVEALLKDMEVDMSVAPVAHTRGGSAEGYARWSSWVDGGGLKTYAKRRNESLDVRGVSRMSAFLNTGMVSPMRIARLAFAGSGAGKGKFLNEFLTWR
ncbi:phr, partial [Symbiodinium pilosum]